MIFTGRFDRVLNDGSRAIISFVIPAYQTKELKIEDKKDYKIEITEVKSKRSLMQNKMAWQVISDIAKHEGMDSDEVYAQIVKQANIKTDIFQVLPEAIERLSRVFKLVVERDKRTSPKGIEMVVVECYYGSSQFDSKEMSDFIDKLLFYAQSVGIDTSQYGDNWV